MLASDGREDGLPRSLPELLARAARRFAHRSVYLVDRRGRHEERRTYPELHLATQRTAARLATLGVRRGQPVLIALPTSWGWLETWFGTLLLGGLPVAVAPAGALGASEAQIQKLDWLLGHLGAERVVCSAAFGQAAERQGARRVAAAALAVEEIEDVAFSGLPAPAPADPEETAYLQLTSGSTGSPRAVRVSHRNALHDATWIDEVVGLPYGAPIHTWADAWVSWLPLHHDMGLVGCLLSALFCGLDLWLLSPQAFLSRPHVWLERLGRCGVTMATGPNFGYQLCVERVRPEQLEGIDLSRWRVALCGAEMVRRETSEAFCARFAASGFSPNAFRPCYGLAEATLAVTVDNRGEGTRTLPAPEETEIGTGISEVVCTGEPFPGTELRVVAPDGTALAEGRVGEVEVRGPGVFAGYYNDPEATDRTLVGGWLKTGDLGFLHRGELYLTGRSKEVLIIHGQNVMPEELERQADAVTGGGGLFRAAAFSVTEGPRGEQAVVVAEIEDSPPEQLPALAREIRRRIGEALELPLADVVFVRRGRIPRTTSGKLRRTELRQRYLEGRIDRLG